MDWGEFEVRLVGVLRDLAFRTYVVVEGLGSSGLVEFSLDADGRSGEMGWDFDATAPIEQVREGLRAIGCEPLNGREDQLARYQDWPASSRDLREIASGFTLSLREDSGLLSTEQLSYRAWRYMEPIPAEGTATAVEYEALDPGDRYLIIPELGLRRQPIEAGP